MSGGRVIPEEDYLNRPKNVPIPTAASLSLAELAGLLGGSESLALLQREVANGRLLPQQTAENCAHLAQLTFSRAAVVTWYAHAELRFGSSPIVEWAEGVRGQVVSAGSRPQQQGAAGKQRELAPSIRREGEGQR